MTIAFGFQNKATASSLSGPAAAGFPATNLAGPRALPPWRTSGVASPQRFDIDALGTRWDCIAVFRTNLSSAATIRVDLSSVSAGGTDVLSYGPVSAGIVPGYNQVVVVLPTPATARYCRVTLNDPTNPDGYIQAGLCYAGSLWTPANNYNYGNAIGWQDDSDIQVTKGGQEYEVPKPLYRAGTLTMGLLSETEVWDDVNEIDRLLGVTGNLLVIPDQTSSRINQAAIFGRMKASDLPTHPDYGIHAKNYDVRERL